MSPERWQQINQLFYDALARPLAERAAFLARACGGDEELRREVLTLLAAEAKPNALVEEPLGVIAADLWSDLPDTASLPVSVIGAQLGTYQILHELGRGGMGEVYLAQDQKLGRRVALKLLPTRFTHDPERLHRFRQEARAASALNHPNIVTIFDIGQEQGRHFMATEFVEGETLRAALKRERFAPAQSLDIAIQIASALDAAHDVGIIHRDIKPENIMLRPDGYVKVLDFGLAKLTEPGSESEDETGGSDLPVSFETRSGMVLGTVSYMSPEQARGQKVDARTDIFSLGVVFYELLTGVRPFDGTTYNHTLVAILDHEPPPLAQHLSAAPAALPQIVNRMLAKERDARYPSTTELLAELKRLKDVLVAEQVRSSGKMRPTDTATAWPANTGDNAAHTTTRLKLFDRLAAHQRSVTIALVVMLVALGGLGAWRWWRPRPALSLEQIRMTRLSTNGSVDLGVISPDGKYAAYMLVEKNESSTIWLQQLATGSNLQLVPAAPGYYSGLHFSPDSTYLYYVTLSVAHQGGGDLYRIPVIGGAPEKVLSNSLFNPPVFTPDGRRMLYRRYNFETGLFELVVAQADGSAPRVLVSKGGPMMNTLNGYGWTRRGDRIMYVNFEMAADGIYYYVAARPAEGGPEQRLTPPRPSRIDDAIELPDRSGLLLNAIDPNLGLLQLWLFTYADGQQRRLTNDLNEYNEVSLSADGSKLLATQRLEPRTIWVAPFDQLQNAQDITVKGNYDALTWTPDGKLLYTVHESDRSELRLMTVDNRQQMLLAATGNGISAPAISADNQTIIYTRTSADNQSLWQMEANGRNAQPLLQGEAARAVYSPDGQWIVYEARTGGKWTIWKRPIAGGAPTQLTTEVARRPAVSPDGQWLAYEAVVAEGRRSYIAVQPFAGGAPVKTFAAQLNFGPLAWTPDSRALLYIEANRALKLQPLAGGPAQTLLPAPVGEALRWFALSRDGKQLAFVSGHSTHALVLFSKQD